MIFCDCRMAERVLVRMIADVTLTHSVNREASRVKISARFSLFIPKKSRKTLNRKSLQNMRVLFLAAGERVHATAGLFQPNI